MASFLKFKSKSQILTGDQIVSFTESKFRIPHMLIFFGGSKYQVQDYLCKLTQCVIASVFKHPLLVMSPYCFVRVQGMTSKYPN